MLIALNSYAFFHIYNTEKYACTAKGYITVKVLRDILHELDDKITPGDLDLMIDEIDADGSGTVDFEGIHTNRA